jgi:hypothetical protein
VVIRVREEFHSSQEPPTEETSETEFVFEPVTGKFMENAEEGYPGNNWTDMSQLKKRGTLKRYKPAFAARQSTRVQTMVSFRSKLSQAHQEKGEAETGVPFASTNSFSILDSCDDDMLEEIASDCDIILGNNDKEIEETLNSIKLEEQLRVAMAEAKYILLAMRSRYSNMSQSAR